MSFRSAIIQKNFVFKDLEEKARKAKNEKKIFVILEGYEPLRQSLLARDWVEKIPDNQLSLISSTSEKFVMALLLKNCPFFFVWQPKSRPIKNGFNVYPCNSSVLRYSPYDFTSKEGLNNCAENHRWHHIDGLTDMNYQRAHVLSDKLSRDEFSEDYRNTAVTSFILFLDNAGADFSLFFSSEDNSVCTECITFAIQKVDFLISVEEHEDLDTNQAADYFGNFPFNQKESLVQIRQITNRTKKFKHESLSITEAWKMAISECAEKIKNQWPHLKYDGFRNVWIMKPLGASCGYGITVMNSERAILMESQLSQQRFLVQKYIGK